MFFKTYFQTVIVYLFRVIIVSHLLLFLNSKRFRRCNSSGVPHWNRFLWNVCL